MVSRKESCLCIQNKKWFQCINILIKTIWGRIGSAHGNNGVVKAKFSKNLPPRAIGATLRVMLYPQRH